jgi:hypothetical protein
MLLITSSRRRLHLFPREDWAAPSRIIRRGRDQNSVTMPARDGADARDFATGLPRRSAVGRRAHRCGLGAARGRSSPAESSSGRRSSPHRAPTPTTTRSPKTCAPIQNIQAWGALRLSAEGGGSRRASLGEKLARIAVIDFFAATWLTLTTASSAAWTPGFTHEARRRRAGAAPYRLDAGGPERCADERESPQRHPCRSHRQRVAGAPLPWIRGALKEFVAKQVMCAN